MKQAPTQSNTNREKNKENDNQIFQNELLEARKKLKEKNSEPGFKWLTQPSRDFLSSGYISGNISAEQRIREIADNAEKILKIKGFSDKFFHYMSEGYYSLASPVWSNFGKSGDYL